MSRRIKPLTSDQIEALPSNCAGCVFWESQQRLPKRCGAECDREQLAGWIDYVRAQWGDCGKVAWEDGEVLGFIKYAPAPYFPQTAHFLAGQPSDKAVLLSCMHIEPEARHHGLGKLLLQAALRDLVQRNQRTVEAYATTHQGDWDTQPTMGLQFLQRSGFQVTRPHPEFPLVRLDLRSLAAWTESIESVLESLRFPLRVPKRAPTPFVETEQGRWTP